MADTKRWIVTYTKHMKQKRKVYQDGVLELCDSGNKVMLYDDSEKLIDSRFLKKDEVIETGGTLSFETHLVDIGVPKGKHNPLSELNACGKDTRSNEPNGTTEQKGNKKSALRSGWPQNHSNVMWDSTREWNALYTTQITQKAKKYHDGILRLSVCGSQMSQVTLLNEDGAVLAMKYLKSVESLKTGNKFELPNYLIEISEPRILQKVDRKEGFSEQAKSSSLSCGKPMVRRQVLSSKPLPNALVKGRSEQVMGTSSSSASKTMNIRISMSDKPSCNEWNALYTSQITKKAKSYHDGILQLSCYSHMSQVILLHEDGTILTSKYLKSVECVKSGNSLELPNYFVEICEPRTPEKVDLKGPSPQVASSSSSSVGKFMSNRKIVADLETDPSEQVPVSNNSSVSQITSSNKLICRKPLRNACQILSILNKSMPEESHVLKELPVEQMHSSESSVFILSDPQSKDKELHVPGLECLRKPLKEDSKDDHEGIDIGVSTQIGAIKDPCREPRLSQKVLFSGVATWKDIDGQPHDCCAPSSVMSGAVVPDMSAKEQTKCTDAVCNGGPGVSDMTTTWLPRVGPTNTSATVSSGNGSPNGLVGSIGEVVPVNKSFAVSSNGKQSLADLSCNYLKENIGTNECRRIGVNDIWSIDSLKVEDSNLVTDAENRTAEGCEGILSPGASSPACAGSYAKNKFSELQISTKNCQNVDEFPSFDLGF